jgi:hypothetical protein
MSYFGSSDTGWVRCVKLCSISLMAASFALSIVVTLVTTGALRALPRDARVLLVGRDAIAPRLVCTAVSRSGRLSQPTTPRHTTRVPPTRPAALPCLALRPTAWASAPPPPSSHEHAAAELGRRRRIA